MYFEKKLDTMKGVDVGGNVWGWLLPLNQTKFYSQIFHGTLNFSYCLIVSHF